VSAQVRIPLTRERVCQVAMRVADEGGLAAVTMRRLAEVLGVEAMSLYYHVSNKDDVLDGLVDAVAEEIDAAVLALEPGPDWRASVRRRILTARQVLLRHRWAPGLLVARNPTSMAMMRYHDGLVGLMHDGGLSYDLIHHALHALGSRALGFVQELADTGNVPVSDEALDAMAGHLPHLAGMLREVAHDDPESTLGWCDDQTEFEFGLDLILDGLDRAARATK
jgi:AcrR family transcriptional regulator